MARPKTPTKIKELKGTLRPGRETGNEPEIDPCRPDAPAWLTGSALDTFNELADELAEMQVVGTIDRWSLAVLAGCLDQLEQQFREGLPIQAALLGQVRGLFKSFGLTPSDRASLNIPAKTETKVEGFAALGF